MLLADEVAVVTGAASERGIGAAIARRFAEEGARVAVLDRDGEGAQRRAAALSGPSSAHECDVTVRPQVQHTFEAVTRELGSPTILVNNAGITGAQRLEEITQEDYDAVLDINLRGTFLCCQAATPYMRDEGHGAIVSISSESAIRGGGIFGGPHYSAAKAGIIGLSRALARDLARWGIRVNAVAPGLVDTDIFEGQLSSDDKLRIAESVPLGRLAEPADVADTSLFLASRLSRYVTGTVMHVNGGHHIG